MEHIFDRLPVLLVDGNYFGHRAIHGLNKGGTDFKLNTTLEMMQFEQELYNQLMGLYTSFNNNYHTLINGICFVFDADSWRKTIEPHRPYYIKENSAEKIGYKENREDDEESGINWENWRMCLSSFQERIETFLPVFRTNGAEGDDSLFFMTNFLSKKGIPSIVFCTDGDLKQLCKNNVIIYQNTKSKELPDGVITISKELAGKYYKELTPMEKLRGNMGMSDLDKQFLTNLFQLQINSGGTKACANRTWGNGISTPDYKTDAFIKCIVGDKKDNIFPIFRWEKETKKGIQNFKVTEVMITKALKPHGLVLNDESLEVMLSDTDEGKESFINLLLGLQHNTGQVGISKNVVVHYKHNYRMNILAKENIPEWVAEAFLVKLKENIPLLNEPLSYQKLLEMNKKRADDGADILKSSVDTTVDILNLPPQPSDSYTQKMNDELDAILGM